MPWPLWAQTTLEQSIEQSIRQTELDQVWEVAPRLCDAICPTHNRFCNLHLKPDEHEGTGGWHVCQYGNTHEFYEATHDTPTPILG